MVECLTLDQEIVGLSLTRGTLLCPLARHFILCLVLVQPRKTHLELTEKNVDWDIKNQNKQNEYPTYPYMVQTTQARMNAAPRDMLIYACSFFWLLHKSAMMCCLVRAFTAHNH